MNHNKFLNELVQTLVGIKDEKLMKDFLIGILTPKELEEIPVRLQIVKALKKKTSHRKIANDLKIGVATVSRGSREIKAGRFKAVKVNK